MIILPLDDLAPLHSLARLARYPMHYLQRQVSADRARDEVIAVPPGVGAPGLRQPSIDQRDRGAGPRVKRYDVMASIVLPEGSYGKEIRSYLRLVTSFALTRLVARSSWAPTNANPSDCCIKHAARATSSRLRGILQNRPAMRTALLLVFLAVAVHAQPFTFDHPPFEPEISEAAMRKELNYTGFTYDFNTAAVRLRTPSSHMPV